MSVLNILHDQGQWSRKNEPDWQELISHHQPNPLCLCSSCEAMSLFPGVLCFFSRNLSRKEWAPFLSCIWKKKITRSKHHKVDVMYFNSRIFLSTSLSQAAALYNWLFGLLKSPLKTKSARIFCIYVFILLSQANTFLQVIKISA